MKLLALVAHVKWAFAFLGVVAFSLFSFNPLGGGDYRLTAPFDTAAGLYPGSDVLIAGAKVGSVQDIHLHGANALVTFSIDPAHAPVYADATVSLRPKSLLGEKYIQLDPGTNGHGLSSGTVLSASHVKRAVDLEELVNTFDAPTREKLRTLVIELGGGLAGQGDTTNETFTYGTSDMNDMAAIAQTLQNRDQQLQEVLQALNAVMAELSRSDRRAELGQLIVNTDRMMKTLADEDGRLQQALVEASSALHRTDVALAGTGPNLAHVFQTLPSLVHNVHGLTTDFGSGLDTLLYTCPANCQEYRQEAGGNTLFQQLLTGIDTGPVVFGGKDSQGYATRIAVLASPNSFGAGSAPTDCSKLKNSPALYQLCGMASGHSATGTSNQTGSPDAIYQLLGGGS